MARSRLQLAAWALVVAALSAAPCAESANAPSTPQNVLLIVVDDLKPALGCFDDPLAISPNIDSRIASDGGFVFTNHHVSSPECAPSRASMLSGLRVPETRIYHFEPHFRKFNKDRITLPGWFRKQGYRTYSYGKVFDASNFAPLRKYSVTQSDLCDASKPDLECSWDVNPAGSSIAKNETLCEHISAPKRNGKNMIAVGYGPLNGQIDYCAATAARMQIEASAEAGESFFLAVGFYKPHLPFFISEDFWMSHELEKFETVEQTYAEVDPDNFFNQVSDKALRSDNEEFHNAVDGFNTANTSGLNRAYYAAATQTDHFVGSVLDKLDEYPAVKRNTIVVFWGDHGYHLGDHGMWAKKTVFEQATRAPLIIRPSEAYREANPGMLSGGAVPMPTEAVDIMPTIIAMAGLGTPYPDPMSGADLQPFFFDLEAPGIKTAAISLYDSYTSKRVVAFSVRFRHLRAIVLFRKRRKEILYNRMMKAKTEVYNIAEDPLETQQSRDNLEAILEYVELAKSDAWDEAAYLAEASTAYQEILLS